MGYVVQQKVLFPHLTIQQNVEFGIYDHKDKAIKAKEMLENFGTPSDVISATMDEMQNNHSFSYAAIFQNYANALLRNAIFGLIIAAIFKKS